MSQVTKRKTAPTRNTPANKEEEVATTKAPELLVQSPSKWKNFATRSIAGIIMASTFFLILYNGQVWCTFVILGLQIACFREITALGYRRDKESNLPGFRFLSYYFLFVTIFYLYGLALRDQLWTWPVISHFIPFTLQYHTLTSYGLYCLGLVMFVLSLKKGLYKYQFKQYGWSHMVLLVIVATSTLFIYNLYEGMIWFVLPVALVVLNDIYAYLSGFFFGRTPLIELSPKKTWEGFIGALIFTVISGFVLGGVLSEYQFMICPKTAYNAPLECTPSAVFLPREYQLPETLTSAVQTYLNIQLGPVTLIPMQIHGVIIALFASLIAPFAGFFASGLKRAMKIKDFSDTIPGHGGITDRMDCQMLMGVFVFVYYYSLVVPSKASLEAVLDGVSKLQVEDQLRVYNQLATMLSQAGVNLPANNYA